MGRSSPSENRHERDPLEHYYQIVLLDTADLDDRGCPKHKAVIGMLLDRPRREIDQLSGAAGTARLDEAIVTILTPEAIRAHLDGMFYVIYEICCGRCGGALGIDRCLGCKRRFSYDGFSALHSISVPPKVRAWLAARGYKFEHRS